MEYERQLYHYAGHEEEELAHSGRVGVDIPIDQGSTSEDSFN